MGDQRTRGSPGAFLDLLAKLELGFARLLRREGTRLDFTSRLVRGEDYALVRDEMIDQSKLPGILRPVEDPLPPAEYDRIPDQHQPIDQPGRDQRRIERTASLDEQVAAFAFLELLDRSGGLTRQLVAIVPRQRLV